MVDSIGLKNIPTMIKIKPVADRDAEEHKRKREQGSGNSPTSGGSRKNLGNNIDERC